jgi:hypothetical protein
MWEDGQLAAVDAESLAIVSGIFGSGGESDGTRRRQCNGGRFALGGEPVQSGVNVAREHSRKQGGIDMSLHGLVMTQTVDVIHA